jgi:hypothetical protein
VTPQSVPGSDRQTPHYLTLDEQIAAAEIINRQRHAPEVVPPDPGRHVAHPYGACDEPKHADAIIGDVPGLAILGEDKEIRRVVWYRSGRASSIRPLRSEYQRIAIMSARSSVAVLMLKFSQSISSTFLPPPSRGKRIPRMRIAVDNRQVVVGMIREQTRCAIERSLVEIVALGRDELRPPTLRLGPALCNHAVMSSVFVPVPALEPLVVPALLAAVAPPPSW